MNCQAVTELLLRYKDGELGAEETEVLRTHLHKCPPCADVMGGYETLLAVLRRLKPHDLPDGYLARLKGKLGGSPS